MTSQRHYKQYKICHTHTCTHAHLHTHMHTHIHTCTHAHTRTHTYTHTHIRFVSKMPTSTLFIIFSFLLRTVEGVGTGMYSTVAYNMLTQLYPNRKATVIVSISINYNISTPAFLTSLQVQEPLHPLLHEDDYFTHFCWV